MIRLFSTDTYPVSQFPPAGLPMPGKHISPILFLVYLDPLLNSAAIGIVIGGLLPLSIVPLMEKYVTKSKYHVVVGDHDDLKKDLKNKHI